MSPTPCRTLLQQDPTLADGWYQFTRDEAKFTVYCDMKSLGGGWTRVIDFDSNVNSCPGEWYSYEEPKVCGLGTPGCGSNSLSAWFPDVYGAYREVRGTLLAYQFFSTDAFGRGESGTEPEFWGIDESYVDGVSITYGKYERRHIWTFASGLNTDPGWQSCPCIGGNLPPPFVGKNYFCDSAHAGGWEPVWYLDKPLWDADATDGNCQTGENPRWFYRQLPKATSEPIEIRILSDQCDEDAGIVHIELYVR